MKNLKEKLWEIVTSEKHNYLGETIYDKELENALFKILEYLIEERKTSFKIVRSHSIDKLLYHLNGIRNLIGDKNTSGKKELRLNKNVERIFMEGDVSDARNYFKDVIMNAEEWINTIKKVYGEVHNERVGVQEDINFWIEYKVRLNKIRNLYFSEEKEFLCNCLDKLDEIILKKSIEILFLQRGIFDLARYFSKFYTDIKQEVFFLLKPNYISEVNDKLSVEYKDENIFKNNIETINNYELIYKKIELKLFNLKDLINAEKICEEKKFIYAQEKFVKIFINVMRKLEKRIDGPMIIRRSIILIMNELRDQLLKQFCEILNERTYEAFEVFEGLRKDINTTGVGEVKGIWMYYGEVRRICSEIKIYKECIKTVTALELEEVIKWIGNEYNNYLKKISKEKKTGNNCEDNEDIKSYKEDLEEGFKSGIFRLLIERKAEEFERIIIKEIQEIQDILIKYRIFNDSEIFMEKTRKKRMEFLERVCEYLYSKLRIEQEDDYYELVVAINYSKKILEFYEDSILVNSMKDTIKNAEEWIDRYIIELDISINELYILERVEKGKSLNYSKEIIYIDSLKRTEISDNSDYRFDKLNIINNLNIEIDRTDYIMENSLKEQNRYSFDNYKINNLDILIRKIEILNKINQYICSNKIRKYVLESNIIEKKYNQIKNIYNEYMELYNCGIRSYIIELYFKYMIGIKWRDCNIKFESLNEKLDECKIKWYSFEKKMVFFLETELPKYFREELSFNKKIKEKNKTESKIEDKNKSSFKIQIKKSYIFNDKPEEFISFFINLNFDQDFIIAIINRVMNRIKKIFCDIMIEKLQIEEEYIKYSVVLDNDSIYNSEKIRSEFYNVMLAPGININGIDKNKELNQLIEEKWKSFLYFFRKIDNDIINNNRINSYNNEISNKDQYRSFKSKEYNNGSDKKYNKLSRWLCNKNQETKFSEYEYEILNLIINENNNNDSKNIINDRTNSIDSTKKCIGNIKFEEISYFRKALETLTFSILAKNKIRYFDIKVKGLEELESRKKKEFDIFCKVFEELTDTCLRIKEGYSVEILTVFKIITQALDRLWKEDNELFNYEINKGNKVFKEIVEKLNISPISVLQPKEEWKKNIYSKALKLSLEYEKDIEKIEKTLDIAEIMETDETEGVLSQVFLYNFIEFFSAELSELDNDLNNKSSLIPLEIFETIFESYKSIRLILGRTMNLKLEDIEDISAIRFELSNISDGENINNGEIIRKVISVELKEILNCNAEIKDRYMKIVSKTVLGLEYLEKLNKSSKYYNIKMRMAEYINSFKIDAAEMAIAKQKADESIITDILRMESKKIIIKVNKKGIIKYIENVEEIEEGIIGWCGELDIINKFNEYKLYVNEIQEIESRLGKEIKIIEKIREIQEAIFEYKNILENKDELYDLSVKQYNELLKRIVEKQKEEKNNWGIIRK